MRSNFNKKKFKSVLLPHLKCKTCSKGDILKISRRRITDLKNHGPYKSQFCKQWVGAVHFRKNGLAITLHGQMNLNIYTLFWVLVLLNKYLKKLIGLPNAGFFLLYSERKGAKKINLWVCSYLGRTSQSSSCSKPICLAQGSPKRDIVCTPNAIFHLVLIYLTI